MEDKTLNTCVNKLPRKMKEMQLLLVFANLKDKPRNSSDGSLSIYSLVIFNQIFKRRLQ